MQSSVGRADIHRSIAEELGKQGWCATPDFVDRETAAALAGEARSARRAERFRRAGVGRGAGWELRPEIRTDRVMWLDPLRVTPAQSAYLERLERLRLAINETLFLGLFDFEGHFAVYPPGTFYRKHQDQFRDLGTRLVTCVVYLNDHWRPEWGGALRLYLEPDDGNGRHVDIFPQPGKLVTFLTRDYYHEVLPTLHNRYSITGWFRQRETA